jgi:hypothetical protein
VPWPSAAAARAPGARFAGEAAGTCTRHQLGEATRGGSEGGGGGAEAELSVPRPSAAAEIAPGARSRRR